MQQYYFDTWVEDGSAKVGYHATDRFEATKLKKKKGSDFKVGDAVTQTVEGPVTRTQIVKYAGASYDYNPIHHDEEFAKRSRSGGIIAHGMMVMGYVGKCAVAFFGTPDLDKIQMRSVQVTRPGDVVTIGGKVEKVERTDRGTQVTLSMTATNQTGEPVGIGMAVATIKD